MIPWVMRCVRTLATTKTLHLDYFFHCVAAFIEIRIHPDMLYDKSGDFSSTTASAFIGVFKKASRVTGILTLSAIVTKVRVKAKKL
jgi:hypothetical protein